MIITNSRLAARIGLTTLTEVADLVSRHPRSVKVIDPKQRWGFKPVKSGRTTPRQQSNQTGNLFRYRN